MTHRLISREEAKQIADAAFECADKALIWKAERDEALARIAALTELLRELLQGEDHSGVWVSEDWFRRAREDLPTTLAAERRND